MFIQECRNASGIKSKKNCLHFLEDQLIFRDHIHTEGIDILFRTIPLYTWTYMSVSFNFANPTSI